MNEDEGGQADAGSSGAAPAEGIDRVCGRFEAAWKEGKQPRIEDYLDEVEEQHRMALLGELLLVELNLRLRGGEQPSRQLYLERFPSGVTAVEAAFRTSGSLQVTELEPGTEPVSASPAEPASASVTVPAPDHTTASPGPWRPREADQTAAAPCPGSPIDSGIDPARIGRYSVRRRLGEGGIGRIYLAWDDDLKRTVAIKVPRLELFHSADHVELFLNEARAAAQLRHPAIVAVHDVGRQPDGSIYIVLEYVDGRELSDILSDGGFSIDHLIGLMARVADAAHYAHKHGLVHRDLKPSNILVDSEGNPRVADFGLAVHEDIQRLRWGEVAGTLPYMAPEQVRGETHRLDGRTDVWALGVILYRILTGRKPFSGATNELMDEIRYRDPKPPRQINDAVPKELERICLKCLSKRMTDRYNSALDLADDVRHFQNRGARGDSAGAGGPPERVVNPNVPGDPSALATDASAASGQRVQIVPKGLCSFDENDADFFLELLPGPRDRDGLPDSLRFWKTRIEASDPDKTFRVGLIYGPSGCGKSSLIKAGLLPCLGPQVTSVYVEAAIEETEVRLLRALRKAVSELPHDSSLAVALASLRERGLVEPRPKVLIVLDQLEQWLFGRNDLEASELVAALRQCDGEHLQAICLVRDDFWMAATRFLRELEVDLVSDRNVAAVDLFDAKHARKVLAAYGRAYDALPKRDDFSREQNAFLDQAVAGLLQEGRIVPVRLALFAEMVRGKPWTTSTLHEVGGMDGVGLRFLDETFSSPRSNPKHRFHQNAAQAVLTALLPQGTTDIKGRMRSFEELRDLSGYAERPLDFADLMRVLDNELRLITPVDLESSVDEDLRTRAPGTRFYQLAHDYLVHSLRAWLTRKQRETRRGRAELLLAERAALWNAKPEDRHLPGFMEWANILALTKPRTWTEPAERMMRRASRVLRLRAAGLTVLVCGLLAAALLLFQANHAAGLVQQLFTAEIAQVPDIVRNMRGYRLWTDPELKRIVNESPDRSKEKLHASIALLPVDAKQVDYLLRRVSGADPVATAVLRDSLRHYQSKLVERLWAELRAANSSEPLLRVRILPVAGLLAQFDPRNPGWMEVGDKVAGTVVRAEIGDVSGWLDVLSNVRNELTGPLARIFRDKTRPEFEQTVATTFLARYTEDRPEILVDLLLDAELKSFSILFPVVEKKRTSVLGELKKAIAPPPDRTSREIVDENLSVKEQARLRDQGSVRRARAAVALVRLGEADEEVWRLLVHTGDPSTRSFMISAFYSHGVESATLIAKLEGISRGGPPGSSERPADGPRNGYLFDPLTSTQRSLLLALAGYPKVALEREELDHVARLVEGLYARSRDAGVHSSAELLLRRWGYEDSLNVEAPPPRDREPFGRRWYINNQGQTLVLVDGPIEFHMGSPPFDPLREQGEIWHRRLIPRRFAIASREVTVQEFQKHALDSLKALHKHHEALTEPNGPQNSVSWFEAVAYCNWVSAKEGRRLCYKPNQKGEFGAGMEVDAAAVAAGGYRLPTEAEWEYACRAGTTSSRYFGSPAELLKFYEWYSETSGDRAHRCGELLPNDLGLFDLLANVSEWCHDCHTAFPSPMSAPLSDPIEDERVSGESRYLRSDSFEASPRALRSAVRGWFVPSDRKRSVGFRIARTCP